MRKLILASVAIATIGAALPAVAQPIDQREHRQQQRIRRGLETGQLTPAEVRRLHFLEMSLRRTEARMRSQNGGRLTVWERRRLRQIANRDSAAIYRLKHNERSF